MRVYFGSGSKVFQRQRFSYRAQISPPDQLNSRLWVDKKNPHAASCLDFRPVREVLPSLAAVKEATRGPASERRGTLYLLSSSAGDSLVCMNSAGVKTLRLFS